MVSSVRVRVRVRVSGLLCAAIRASRIGMAAAWMHAVAAWMHAVAAWMHAVAARSTYYGYRAGPASSSPLDVRGRRRRRGDRRCGVWRCGVWRQGVWRQGVRRRSV